MSDGKCTNGRKENTYHLYLLAIVSDDAWVDTADGGWPADMLRLYFDSLPPPAIPGSPSLLWPSRSLVTATTELLELRIGQKGAIQPGADYHTHDPMIIAGLARVRMTLTMLDSLQGIAIEIFSSSDSTRTVEARLPWALFSVRGFAISEQQKGQALVPASATTLALACTYWDTDTVPQDTAVLSWTGKDPWDNDNNYWGHLVCGLGFPPEPTPVESLLVASVERPMPREERQTAASGDQRMCSRLGSRGLTVSTRSLKM
ncbi:MAG: hypothetical protein GF331_04725 [Chitinivibrionales bacterium]|nr:hypothetical protein [Chitinivibrionales bacterium]